MNNPIRYRARICDKAGRVLHETTGGYDTREDAARVVFALARSTHTTCSTFYGAGCDIRWHRRGELGAIDTTAAGAQHVLPGAERVSSADMAQRQAAAPLKASKPQAACNVGLFSDDRNQTELF